MNLTFRPTEEKDIPFLLEMAAEGRAQLKRLGVDQWQGDYPSEQDFRQDMANGCSYVADDGRSAVGTMAVCGHEPDYDTLVSGAWLNDQPYACFHRVCVLDRAKGMGVAGFLFAEGEKLVVSRGISNIRGDTHPDNLPMQRALTKFGFQPCGRIEILENENPHSPRLVYHLIYQKVTG